LLQSVEIPNNQPRDAIKVSERPDLVEERGVAGGVHIGDGETFNREMIGLKFALTKHNIFNKNIKLKPHAK
jgi:hypothetical protein